MKLLFVGLGGAGQRHLRTFRQLLGDRATCLAWRARGREGAIAPDFSKVEQASLGVTTFPTLEAALEQKPDAVLISNPTSLHLPVALAAARAGAHVLVEKPLSHTLEGLDELQRALAGSGRIGLVGYMMRFHPCLRRIREWILDGRFGSILSVRMAVASYVPDWHPYEDYRTLYAVKKSLGGGVVLTESHELDLATWFFGKPRRVFAVGGALSGASGDVEDTASIMLDYGFPVHVQLCFMQRPQGRSCEISGTRASAAWSGGNSLRLFEGSWSESTFEGHDRSQLFRDQASHFVACMERREQPEVSVEAGAESLKLALAALRSLQDGTPVEV